MLYGPAALNHAGMPTVHGMFIQEVVERTRHAVIFRAVGQHCTLLLKEGYATKGFRIDAKSCDWGPMKGFVCADPRLAKNGGDDEGVAENRGHTKTALAGTVRHDAIGGLTAQQVEKNEVIPEWTAGCKPIVISRDRYQEIRGELGGEVGPDGIIRGVARDGTGKVRFPWALIPVSQCARIPSYTTATGELPENGYGVFVDNSGKFLRFQQDLPAGVRPIRVQGNPCVLGLINPETAGYGYKACVTGDYDLFGVWPPVSDHFGHPSGPNWDTRYVAAHQAAKDPAIFQHYKLGNITGRIKTFKVLLNTALIGGGGFPGGNLVHHSDEVGNPSKLQKTLAKSYPLLAFLPMDVMKKGFLWPMRGVGILEDRDFGEFVKLCQKSGGIAPELRPEWRHFLVS